MKVHYFQRYHQHENVATANTMLLLSRLYEQSPDKFFKMLNSYISELIIPEIKFTIQERNKYSVPDATITQDSFKIVIETKIGDWFHGDQLYNHLKSFNDENLKVLISISSERMKEKKLLEFNDKLDEYNQGQNTPIIHINTTFEELSAIIEDVIDDRDYEMQDILEDYIDYCYHDGLISNVNAWKNMRIVLTGTTFDFNRNNNLYYHGTERGFREHDYIGLYTNKSVRAVGRVKAMIKAVQGDNNEIVHEVVKGEYTQEIEEKIKLAMEDARRYGYDLYSREHMYFFV